MNYEKIKQALSDKDFPFVIKIECTGEIIVKLTDAYAT